MVYKILIKDPKTSGYTFATTREDVPTMARLADGSIGEVPSGKTRVVTFQTDDINVLQSEYLKLMEKYPHTSLEAIADMTETVSVIIKETE